MKNVTLILPLEATTDINTSNSSGVAAGVTAVAIAGVKAVALIDYDRATDSGTIDQC